MEKKKKKKKRKGKKRKILSYSLVYPFTESEYGTFYTQFLVNEAIGSVF